MMPPFRPRVSSVLRAVRTEHHALLARPSDLASVIANRLAAENPDVPWPVIGESLGVSEMVRLRRTSAIQTREGPTSVVAGHHLTACAVRWDLVVAGTASGSLLAWTRPGDALGLPDPQVAAHTGAIRCLAFVGSNELLISGGDDGLVHLWPPNLRADSEPYSSHRGSAVPVTVATFSSTRQSIVAGAADGAIRVWTREAEEPTRLLAGHTGAVTALVESPDASHIISASADCTLRVWNVETGATRAVLRGHAGRVAAVVIVPGEHLEAGRPVVISASDDGMVKLWTFDGELHATLGGHVGPVRSLHYLSPGVAISAGEDGTVRTWDLDAARQRRLLLQVPSVVSHATPHGGPPARVLAVSGDRLARILDAETGGLLREMKLAGSSTARVAVSSTGNLAACLSDEGVLTRIDLQAPPEHDVHAAFDEHGQLLVGAGQQVLLASLDGARASVEELAATGEPVIAVSVGGQTRAALRADGSLTLWRPAGQHQLPLLASTPVRTTVAVSNRNRVVTGHVDGSVRSGLGSLLRSGIGESIEQDPPHTLPGSGARVTALRWTPESRFVLVASADGVLRLWDPSAAHVVFAFPAHAAAILDCDISGGSPVMLSGADDGSLAVWTGAGTVLSRCEGHEAAVTGCRLSPRVERAMSCSRDHSIKLWDVKTGECLETFYGDAPFVSLTSSPIGPDVAAVDGNGAIVLIRLTDADWMGVSEPA